MHTEFIALQNASPGTHQTLQVMRFGQPGASPKVYVQAALHADEVPAILVAHQLAAKLAVLEASGAINGEIVLVPFANPIGLAQLVQGQHHGRFDLRDGGNFNRGYADLVPKVVTQLQGSLTQDIHENTRIIRHALHHATAELPAQNATQDLKNKLLHLAIDADMVLDLHCDHEAVMHVYGLTPQAPMVEALGAALGARAVLLATESGDSPFDEACTRPWLQLQEMLPGFPIALACFGATVELRGEADTQHTLALQDANGLCNFLAQYGALSQIKTTWPEPQCAATPLSGSEPVTAPCAGVVVFHRQPGDVVAAGDLIADLVDAATGQITPVHCKSSGVLYARAGARWASPGKRLAKIAGTSLARTGKLLSP
ncbi:MAG: succinylglutamate desuccinylase/aspartoacylase family protein [Polaromonas sp.]|nr:MAG: succinylglutamate desuccinylase/aspartoacylase family protein [Polaromonas sp.]